MTKKKGLEAVLEGFLYRGQVTIIAGGPYAGKSTGAFKGLVFPLCRGEKTMFGTQGLPIKVLFCSERDEDFNWEQLRMLGLHEEIPETLKFFYLPDMSERDTDNFQRDQLFYLQQVCLASFKPDLVVFDTMVNFQTIRDTNSYVENQRAMMRLKRWSSLHNCASLSLYHSPKQNERNKYDDPFHKVLGSTAILASSVAAAVMERCNDDVVQIHFRSHLKRLDTPRFFEYVTFKETKGAITDEVKFISVSPRQAEYLELVPRESVPFKQFNEEASEKLKITPNHGRNLAHILAEKQAVMFEIDKATDEKLIRRAPIS